MCGPTTKNPNESTTNRSKIIHPVIPPGFSRRKIPIAASILGLSVFCYGLKWFFQDATWLKPADEFCQNLGDGEKCVRSDLFAKQATSAVMQIYMGGMGLLTWHITRNVVKKIPQTPEGRLFGYLQEADKLNVGIFIYQTFDFFTSMMVPEHNNAIFLTHHVLAAITAWMSLEYQMVHYYAIFFGGCSEISTIFLVLCDLDVYFPAQDGSLWGLTILLCQVSFTLSFFYYRVIGWWQVSFQLWSDVFALVKKGSIEEYRPGKGWFLYGFLVMDFLLGSLQVYWFAFEIVPKVLEVVNS